MKFLIFVLTKVKNNFSYYGESERICKRFGMHLRELEEQTHHNKKLLQAYKEQQNPDGFRFLVLAFGPEWIDKHKRLKRQD